MENEFEHRLYFFNNMYLSSIQQGIQAAHVVAEMFMKYRTTLAGPLCTESTRILKDWALEHKTIIVLNAGYSSELIDLSIMFNSPHNKYPWASFQESPEALNSAVTSVGMVLPYEIYRGASLVGNLSGTPWYKSLGDGGIIMDLNDGRPTPAHYSKWEVELMRKIGQYRLAI